jgi:hypothetical protein
MATSGLSNTALHKFDATYDRTREDLALRSRGDFLRAFPIKRLADLEVDDYVIGLKKPTFCDYVEPKTSLWAVIMGATAFKFGIYYGKTKSDPIIKYRFTAKYGKTKGAAFDAVKKALLELVALGGDSKTDFVAIDENPLSQLFKAKILSLYYPRRFLNVCSKEHLEMLGTELGFGSDRHTSEYQHLLLRAKLDNPITKSWSNPKFMMFLYATYVDSDDSGEVNSGIEAPRDRKPRRVNMEDIQRQWGAIGKAAEEFALKWEKERLHGADLDDLIPRIEDRRDRPGYGYDLLSYSAPGKERYIEVKSVGTLPGTKGYRFFLSDNEHSVSNSNAHCDAYFFYLVFFNGEGEPTELWPITATELYKRAEMKPASYIVGFQFSR